MLVSFLCGMPGVSLGQQANTASPVGVLQLNSKIVVLDVVVTDGKHESVRGLTQNDFAVYEDKVPQTILSFDESTPATPDAMIPVSSTAELDKREPGAAVSIIVLDEVTTKFEDLAFARYSIERYLRAQGDTLLQPTLLLATNYRNISVLHDYTTSRQEILSALQHHTANYAEVRRANDLSWEGDQVAAAFGSVTAVAKATAGHPGHKNVVWIGRGFPAINLSMMTADSRAEFEGMLATCSQLLRDSRITLYTVDPAGISTDDPARDENGLLLDSPFGGQVDFDSMATSTGGLALHGRNDVDRLIDESVRNGESFYTLSYKPTNGNEDAKEFRRIRIVMKNPALSTTTRAGYFAAGSPVDSLYSVEGKYSQGVLFDLDVASENQLVYDGVPLTVKRDAAVPDRFQLGIRAADLPLKPDGSEKPSSELTVLVESFDRKGKLLQQNAHLFTVHLLPGVATGPSDPRSIKVPVVIPTSTPAARIRFIVRANGNGKIGAENFFLDR
jgi:VWFA-related protein